MRFRVDRALCVILVLALVARFAVVLLDLEYAPLYDSGDYDRHAISIANGNGFPPSVFTASPSESAFRPPLYPYVLGAVYFVTDDSRNAGRLVGALFGVVSVLLVFLIARTVWDRRAALFAAALAAVFPGMFFMNGALINEPLFVMCMLAAVWFALLSRERHADLRFAAAAGVCCALGALTRSNGLLLVLAIAFGVWTLRPRFSRRALAAPVVVCLAAALICVPWTVRNAITFGAFVPTVAQTGFAVAGIYNEDAMNYKGYTGIHQEPRLTRRFAPLYKRKHIDEVELDRELTKGGLEFASDHPGYVAKVTVLNALRMFQLADESPATAEANRYALNLSRRGARVERFSFYLLVLLALAGAILIRRMPRERRPPRWMWAIPVLLLAAAFPILGTTRYRLPSYPFLTLAATPVLIAAADRLKARLNARRLQPGSRSVKL